MAGVTCGLVAVPPAALHALGTEQQLQLALVQRPVLAHQQLQRPVQQQGWLRPRGHHRPGPARQRLRGRLPAAHRLGPVVFAQQRPDHPVLAQPCRQPLQHQGQRLPAAGVVGQPRCALWRQRHHVLGRQPQITHRRGQRDVREVLGEQPREVPGLARGLGRAHGQLPALAHPARAHRVVRPVQGERRHAAVPRRQPGRKLQQQAARAEDQGFRAVHPVRQLQPRIEHRRQRDPDVRLGGAAVGLVQRRQQRRIEPPRQPRARQPPQIAQRATADARQGRLVRPHGAQGRHRQRVQRAHQRRRHPVLHPRARQRQRGQGVGCPGQGHRPQFLRLTPEPFAQRRPPAEQAQAGRHLQQHGLFGDGDTGRELQRPDRQRLQRRVSGGRRVVGARQSECGPQHGRPREEQGNGRRLHGPGPAAGAAAPPTARPAAPAAAACAPVVGPCA